MIEVHRFLTEEQAKNCVVEGDAAFDSELNSISDKLLVTHGRFHSSEVKAIVLCGPSCAGKTTTAKKITKMLEEKGKRVHVLSIDDFYYERDLLIKRSGSDKIDFDSPATIDTEELGLTVREIFDDNENVVEVPVYDFLTGKRAEPRFIPVDDRDIFIFEGIQAFYPNVIGMFNAYPTTTIYISPMKSIKAGSLVFEPATLRFMRRIVRDYYRRNAAPEFTFEIWNSVRANEDANIFPYYGCAKIHLNSTVCYEVGMLKPYLDEILPLVPRKSAYYYQAQDLLEAISDFTPIDKKYLSQDSLFHEFV